VTLSDVTEKEIKYPAVNEMGGQATFAISEESRFRVHFPSICQQANRGRAFVKIKVKEHGSCIFRMMQGGKCKFKGYTLHNVLCCWWYFFLLPPLPIFNWILNQQSPWIQKNLIKMRNKQFSDNICCPSDHIYLATCTYFYITAYFVFNTLVN